MPMDSAPGTRTEYAERLRQGRAYRKAKALDAALAEFKAAHQLAPRKSQVRLEIAATLLRLGRVDDAANWLQRLLAREAKLPKPLGLRLRVALGRIAKKRKDAAAAVQHFSAALKLDRTSPAALRGFRYAARILTLKPEAADFLRAAVQGDPDLVPLLLLAGTCLLRIDPAEAEGYFRRALALEPQNVSALIALSRLSWVRGDEEAGARYLSDARAVAPSHKAVAAETVRQQRTQGSYDWQGAIAADLALLERRDVKVYDLLGACARLIRYGIIAPALSVLQPLEDSNRTARHLVLEAQQMRRLGLETPGSATENGALNQLRGCVEMPLAGADTVVIVFAGAAQLMHVSLDVFRRLLQPLGVSAIFLRDLQHAYYVDGVVGLGQGLEPTLQALRERLAGWGVRRVLTLGNSRGNAGALRYGLALGADAVLAFSPNFDLPDDALLPASLRARMEAATPAERQYLRNADQLYREAPRRPRVTMIHAAGYPTDVAEVRKFDGVPDVDRVAITALRQHSCLGLLLAADLLGPLLRDFVEDGRLEPALLDRIRNARKGQEAA